jgi:hypothetical protein
MLRVIRHVLGSVWSPSNAPLSLTLFIFGGIFILGAIIDARFRGRMLQFRWPLEYETEDPEVARVRAEKLLRLGSWVIFTIGMLFILIGLIFLP